MAGASAIFWLGVLQTAIGAGIGFGLGLVGFHYQSRAQRHENQKVAKDTANDALFRALQAATLNIETLANVKMQILEELRAETVIMRGLVERYHEADHEQKQGILREMKEASARFTSFYMTTPAPSALEPPAYSELSLVVRQMPALTGFLHRSMSTLHDVIDRIGERNDLIAQHAVENDAGMSEHRFVYFMSMLTGLAYVICESVDDGLAFFMLVKQQAENYLNSLRSGETFAAYSIAEKALPYLPDENRFPTFRAQIREFDRSGRPASARKETPTTVSG